TLNMEKCDFTATSIKLLGHIIENGSKRPDPERMEALRQYPIPQTMAELNRLLGLLAYYSKWICDFSNKVRPLLNAQKEKKFPLNNECTTAISILMNALENAVLAIPDPKAGHLLLETDASGSCIGAVLSQAGRPIAFFSRTLSPSEQKQSVIEREAMAIVEATRKWNEYLHIFPTVIKTDQKAVSYIYSKQKSRIKNEKLARWRLELSEFNYSISYRRGQDNKLADALSRIAASTTGISIDLQNLHDSFGHPGITRFWEYVRRHNLPFSLADVRELNDKCTTCRECKPRFYSPTSKGVLIQAMRPFERLNMDIVGPKPAAKGTGARFLLVIIDEYSRFPFAFALTEITSQSIIRCLSSLFFLCGTPNFIHTDRGTQFMSEELNNYLFKLGISHSRTTPYNPQGNGQTERYNGVIWKAIQCILHSRGLTPGMWESVLNEALAANRTLLCTATNETPHSRLFKFERHGTQGYSLPGWLRPGNDAYMKKSVRNKDEPLVQPVKITEVINPFFARAE
ncbi:MAG: RNase H-like domain-containing protein, partial [Pseudomonadota bacterium]